MAFARFVTWNLRPGTRDEALEILDGFSDKAKGTKGFKGIFAFRDLDNPNTAYILSLWDSEETLNAVASGLVPRVVKAVGDRLLEPPIVKSMEARELAAQTISIPA
jgi:heme-degrading monooxygenase HmoA